MGVTSIDIFGTLSKKSVGYSAKRGGAAGKVTIDFVVPDLEFAVDEKALAGRMATILSQRIGNNLMHGLAPTGAPMPAVAASTMRRHEYRIKQGARAGSVADRYKREQTPEAAERTPYAAKRRMDFRRRAHINFNKRFKTAQLGSFKPQYNTGRRGLESGVLAKSIKAVPDSRVIGGGSGWTVYVANVRGLVDKKGQSPLERVFRGVEIWNQAATATPAIQAELKNMASMLLVRRAIKLINEIAARAREAVALVDYARSVGE